MSSPEPTEPAPLSDLESNVRRYLLHGRDHGNSIGGTEPELQSGTSDAFQDEIPMREGSRELSAPPTQRNDVVAIGRLARRRKLHPYQITEAEKLVASPLSTQLGTIFVELKAAVNQLDKVLLSQPPFTISKPLDDTISSYTLGVLLSENLSAYKGNIPTDHILAIIQRNKVNVPSNLKQDPYALNLVKSAIGNELIQARARIKRLVGESIIKDWSIYLLAQKVIEGSECNISVALCARLAIMRSVYTKFKGTDYWNNVDSRLEFCRSFVKNDLNAVRTILSGILRDDRNLYGVQGGKYVIPEDTGDFQQEIDDNLKERQ